MTNGADYKHTSAIPRGLTTADSSDLEIAEITMKQ